MEMLSSFRGNKHELCLVVIKFKHVRCCPISMNMTTDDYVLQCFTYVLLKVNCTFLYVPTVLKLFSIQNQQILHVRVDKSVLNF